MLRRRGNDSTGVSLPLLAAAVATLLVPASALGAARGGTVGDKAGDGATPGTDLRSLSAHYDSAGSLSVSFTLGAAPLPDDSPAGLAIRVGRTTADGTCAGAPFVVLAAVADPASPETLMRTSDERDLTAPELAFRGPTVAMTASDPWLANRDWDCAYALVADQERRSDELDTPLALLPTGTKPTARPGPAIPSIAARARQRADAVAACTKKPRAARAACVSAVQYRFAKLAQSDRLARALAGCAARPAGAKRVTCQALARERFATATLSLARNRRLGACTDLRLASRRATCRAQVRAWYARALRAAQLRRALAICATVSPARRRAACRTARYAPPRRT